MRKVNLTKNINQLNLICSSENTSEEIFESRYEYIYTPSVKGNLNIVPQFSLPDRPFIHLHTSLDGAGIVGHWRPDSGFQKQLIGDWTQPLEFNLSHSAPVICFFDGSDKNVFTISVSETSKDIHLLAGVHEENGKINIHIIVHLSESTKPEELIVRFDFRPLNFTVILQETVRWWDTLLPDTPMDVPDTARLPMYSTWYSYHQDMQDEVLINEYQEAKGLGMQAVIIDDGWQTADNNRGYGFCGDWYPESTKFYNFSEHVRKIHSLGMKCILWYSVPFIGRYSKTWNLFEAMLLHYDPILHTGVLDPRYPQVREYLISTYQKAYETWNLDGFKLDFIDSFHTYPDTPEWNELMDFHEIQDAVYCLMHQISLILKEKNPELLIEFRQNYIGPQMRRFGNMFRVGDCPMSGISNRVAITDLKLLSGSTAVHSDMIMWPANETPEGVAIQLINCIFATLQISVRLHDLTDMQKKVLKHYLNFSIKYRDVLLTGSFSVQNPLAHYPVLSSCNEIIWICAVYDSRHLIELPSKECQKECWILNGTTGSVLYLSTIEDFRGQLTIFNCCGDIIFQRSAIEICKIGTVNIPSGGSALFLPQ